ncbi:MAG: tetratricopeptide repeat protein, partial [Deltaproteobacteria bacterium]|nr:tetratricopeptide repeat protein [Deltaproteobacteria bacterium]MBW2536114.1 tetratricopeptide repeat protein [Deltaproteobacteria bacterium]
VALPKPPAVPAEPPPEPEDEGEPDDPRLDLIATCEQELALKPDKVRAARLHYEIGRAELEPKKALAEFRKALALFAEHLPSIRAARKICLGEGDTKGAIALFDAEIELTHDGRRSAMLHYAKGRALEDLDSNYAAARKCFAQASTLDESSPLILKALQHCDLRAGDWAALERARQQEARSVDEDARHRAALMVERARLLETRLSDAESAAELYRGALELDPYAVGALQALKRLLYGRERWQELVDVLQREAEQSTDTGVRTMALFQLARVHSERLGSAQEAIEALVRAMRYSPHDRLVLEELIKLYEPTDETAGLAHTLEQLVEATTEPSERLAVVHRIAELYDLRHGDDEKAAPWYQAALGLDPTFAPAITALDAIYAAQERWQAIIDMRLREAELAADPRRRAEAHARVATIFEVELEQPDVAAQHHAKALSLNPDREGSFKALARLHALADRHRELIELYERAIDRAKDEDVVIAYLFKIGALYEDALHSPGLAIPAYRRVLDRQPSNLGAIHALQRAAETSNHHEDLVDALEREAKIVREPPRSLALIHRAAEILANKLRDRDAAVARYRQILDRDGGHLPTLTSLASLYHRMGRYKDVLDIHERELAVLTDDRAKVTLLVRMAELAHHKLGQIDRAVTIYRRGVELDPQHTAAAQGLARLLRERGDWPGVVRVLEGELASLDDPEAEARAAFMLGEAYEVHLNKPAQAVRAYERALAAVPTHRPSIDALARVNSGIQAWSKTVDALDAEVETAPEPRLAIDALFRAGEVCSELMDATEQAVVRYEAILEQDAGNLAALLALEGLYRKQEAWEQLAVVYTRQSKALRDKRARVATLEALARLLEQHLDNRHEDLRRTYGAILAADSTNPVALEGLERIAIEQDDRDLLADVDSRSTKAEESSAMVAAHFTRLGHCLETGSSAAALAAYRSALEREPDNLAAIRGLARVARKRGDVAASVEAARREAEWTASPQRAADLLVQSAMLRVQQLGDREGAIADAEQALLRCPDHAGAAYRLMELLLWADQIDRLIELLSAAANATQASRRKAQLWQTVANLYADHAADVPAGIAALKRALACKEDDVATLMRLADLYGRDTQWDRAADLLERVVGLEPDKPQRVEAHIGLARIFTEHRPDHGSASSNIHAVLELNPAHREALTLLVQVCRKEGKLDEARDAAARLVDGATVPSDRAQSLLELGRIELELDHRRQAAAALLSAIALAGPAGEAGEEYRRELGSEEPWDRYVDALSDHLRRVEAGELDDPSLPATYLEIARTQREQLGRLPESFETLRNGLRSCGEQPSLGLELADTLARAGRHPESIAEYQRQVHIEPGRELAWRGLARTLQEYGRPGEASAAAAPLIVLGAATEIETNLARQRKTRPGWVRPGSCVPANLHTITAATVKDESLISSMLGPMLEGLGKLFPSQLERFGLSTRDRLSERSEHPLRGLLDRLVQAFGIERCDLYLFHPRYGADVVVELSQPPALLVPSFVAELAEAEQVFMLCRALTAVAQNLQPALFLKVEELQQLLIAGARNAEATFGTGWFDERLLGDLQKRLGKALSRRNRKALEEAAAIYTMGPEVDVSSWVPTLSKTLTRAAAIVAGDLPACLDVIRRADSSLASLDGRGLIEGSELVADLLRFWMSDRALEFRRLVGLV